MTKTRTRRPTESGRDESQALLLTVRGAQLRIPDPARREGTLVVNATGEEVPVACIMGPRGGRVVCRAASQDEEFIEPLPREQAQFLKDLLGAHQRTLVKSRGWTLDIIGDEYSDDDGQY